jgi:hypothetical protein
MHGNTMFRGIGAGFEALAQAPYDRTVSGSPAYLSASSALCSVPPRVYRPTNRLGFDDGNRIGARRLAAPVTAYGQPQLLVSRSAGS